MKSQEFQDVMLQSTQLFHMEQFSDSSQYVNAIGSIKTIREKWKPFNKIALGSHAPGTVLLGLESNNLFADLFVDHIKDTAKASGVNL